MGAALAGFAAGLSLIVAIGAQNAYVLRLGLARRHVGMAVAVCAGADALLIAIGVAGLGAAIAGRPALLQAVTVGGAAFLAAYGLRSLWRARRPSALRPSDGAIGSRRATLAALLAFTFLNPHVYLDTVLLLGTIGAGFAERRWWFAAGAAVASVAWFAALGFGARLASRLADRPGAWRAIDTAIGIVMLALAASLAWRAAG